MMRACFALSLKYSPIAQPAYGAKYCKGAASEAVALTMIVYFIASREEGEGGREGRDRGEKGGREGGRERGREGEGEGEGGRERDINIYMYTHTYQHQ